MVLYRFSFLKWSLIPASSTMGNTSLPETDRDIPVAWMLTLQVRAKAKGQRINLYFPSSPSHLPIQHWVFLFFCCCCWWWWWWSSFCYEVFIAVLLVSFLIPHQFKYIQSLASLISFLCTWMLLFLFLLSPSLLPISVFPFCVWGQSRVPCSAKLASCHTCCFLPAQLALRADVPWDHCSALPFKWGLLVQGIDEDHSISTVLLEEQFILMFPNPLNTNQVR